MEEDKVDHVEETEAVPPQIRQMVIMFLNNLLRVRGATAIGAIYQSLSLLPPVSDQIKKKREKRKNRKTKKKKKKDTKSKNQNAKKKNVTKSKTKNEMKKTEIKQPSFVFKCTS